MRKFLCLFLVLAALFGLSMPVHAQVSVRAGNTRVSVGGGFGGAGFNRGFGQFNSFNNFSRGFGYGGGFNSFNRGLNLNINRSFGYGGYGQSFAASSFYQPAFAVQQVYAQPVVLQQAVYAAPIVQSFAVQSYAPACGVSAAFAPSCGIGAGFSALSSYGVSRGFGLSIGRSHRR